MTNVQEIVALAPFETGAQRRVLGRLEAQDGVGALSALAGYAPTDHEQHVEFERLSGYAHLVLGDYGNARQHLARALRGSRRVPQSRERVRRLAAQCYLTTGDLRRVERTLKRAIASCGMRANGASGLPWLLDLLAVVYRRRGMLSFAIRTLERALSLVREQSDQARFAGLLANSLAEVCLDLGDLDRAEALLREVLEQRERLMVPFALGMVWITLANHAVASGALDAAEAMIAEAQARVSESPDQRIRLHLDWSRADLALARGSADDAVAILEPAFERALRSALLGDMVPGVARRLATALLATGQLDRALDKARLAIQLGRIMDVQEWAAALRVRGLCEAAAGNRELAAIRFHEALSVLETTELFVERRRLIDAMDRVVPANPITGVFERAAPTIRRDEDGGRFTRVTLSDGRAYMTCDFELIARIRTAAVSDLPVLIEGETGTGKELVAHLVHELGPRAAAPFVVVDCTTLPGELAEAELFGTARGAYTGAVGERGGLLASAEGGIVFFDELPELSLAIQGKLLRFLQDGTYRKVGDDRMRRLDVKIVVATNRRVDELLRSGHLKSDLYYRLNGLRIVLSPLRERSRDAEYLAREFARAHGLAGVSLAALDELRSHPWPGNVRQLAMMIRTAATHLGRDGWLDTRSLRRLWRETAALDGDLPSLKQRRSAAERQALIEVIEAHRGNFSAAARSLAISRQALYKALHRAGLDCRGARAKIDMSTIG